MRLALNLKKLRQTIDSFLEERVILEEHDGWVSVELLEPEGPGLGPIKPRNQKHTFPRPQTIQQALHRAVESRLVKDSPEDREDFLWLYKHYVLWFTRNGHLNKGDKIGKGGVR